MCAVNDMVRLGLPEALGKRICAIGQRISGRGGSAVAMVIEQAVAHIEPLLSGVDEAASARDKRAAALRAALDDARWQPQMLQSALGHKSASTVSRYLSGETPIPDRIYALPELGKAFHRRCGQVFGLTEEKSA